MIRRLVAVATAALVGAGWATAAPASAQGGADWSMPRYQTEHTSTNPSATAITPANASSLQIAWHWVPPTVNGRPSPIIYSTPVISNGVVYVGTRSGYLYALDEATGNQLWAADTGYLNTTCGHEGLRGLTGTPTVANGVVYIAGAPIESPAPNGGITLYALNASTGSTEWSTPVTTQAATYAWDSALVVGGNVYVGTSSACDNPLVQGAISEFSAATGALENTFDTVPSGDVGGSVWTDPASNGSDIWITTGNGPGSTNPAYAGSMVHLSADLNPLGTYQPQTTFNDADFGGSPVLFNDGSEQLVAACDKDGYLYALDQQTMQLVWKTQIDSSTGGCLSGAVFANGTLYQSSDQTVINGQSYAGSVRALNPATGTPLWQTGLNTDTGTGTPTLDGAGVMAVPGFHYNLSASSVFLLNASDGNVLFTIPISSSDYAQPVFADNYLFVPTTTTGLFAYQPPSQTGPTAVITSGNCSGLNCSFDGSGSTPSSGATITDYSWQFGDGTTKDTGTTPTVNYTYASGGTYTVTLIVTDSTGAKATTTTTVSPSNGVTAVITSTRCRGLNCSFDGSGSSSTNGPITDYSWNFGDGTSTDAGTSPATTHTYARGATYTVTLTVTDNTGAKASTSTKVRPRIGTGTLTVNPTSVSAGSSGHTFTFTYTSPQTSSAARVLLDIQVPAGWTAPQHTSSTKPGYVRVNLAGCTGASIVSVTGSGPWTIQATASCPSQTGFRVSYGGGGTKVTAPSSPGSYPFTSSVEVSPATTFKQFATQPTVTVH